LNYTFENKIINADCLRILPTIPDNTFDLILSDPPYVSALKEIYSEWNKVDFNILAGEYSRLLKPDGQVCLFSDPVTFATLYPILSEYFNYRFCFYWRKSNGQIINKQMPRSNVEMIHVWKPKHTLTKDVTFNPVMRPGKPYIKRHKAGNPTRKNEQSYTTRNETGERWPDQVLDYPSKDNLSNPERSNAKPFPCYKPISLVGYLFRTLSNPGDFILDNFAGSGSVGIACHRLGRKWLLIESDPQYYRESRELINRELNQMELLNV